MLNKGVKISSIYFNFEIFEINLKILKSVILKQIAKAEPYFHTAI